MSLVHYCGPVESINQSCLHGVSHQHEGDNQRKTRRHKASFSFAHTYGTCIKNTHSCKYLWHFQTRQDSQIQSGLKITNMKDFPSGKQFHAAFQPLHSDDPRILKLIFHLSTAPSVQKIKFKHGRLVDHLRKYQIYLDESHSGSDTESGIGFL
jgi:hypothetical protein